jgi:shikimate dehydrogenase
MRALEEICTVSGQELAILGAGGVARAIAYGAKRGGARITVFNRSRARGLALADALDVSFGGSLEDFRADAFSILINATSAGFRASNINPAEGRLAPHLLVMDAVFIPVETKLIRDARALGCKTISGTRMLIHQACGQVELYTGCQHAPYKIMERALLEEIEKTSRC